MATSLDAMPAEIQFNIFRSLLPHNVDNIDPTDLANLHFTCRSLLQCATEVFFERYYFLLRKENNVYVESKSFKQLRDDSRLANLVRSVWIALVAADAGWL